MYSSPILLVLVLAVVIHPTSSTQLQTHSIISLRGLRGGSTNFAEKLKVDRYARLYKDLCAEENEGETGAGPSPAAPEDNLALFLRANPMLALQFMLSVYVMLSFIVDQMLSMPVQISFKLRQNSLLAVLALKILDILKVFEFVAADVIDAPPDVDLFIEAKKDMAMLIKSQPSHIVAFSLVSLLLGGSHLSTLPFMITEVPYIMRTVVLLSLAVNPTRENKDFFQSSLLKGLFQAPTSKDSTDSSGSDSDSSAKKDQGQEKDEKEPGKTAASAGGGDTRRSAVNVNQTFDFLSYLVQLYLSLGMCRGIIIACSRGSSNPSQDTRLLVRGPSDIAFLVVQLIMLVNSLVLRTWSQWSDNDFVTDVCLAGGKDLKFLSPWLSASFFSSLRSSIEEVLGSKDVMSFILEMMQKASSGGRASKITQAYKKKKRKEEGGVKGIMKKTNKKNKMKAKSSSSITDVLAELATNNDVGVKMEDVGPKIQVIGGEETI